MKTTCEMVMDSLLKMKQHLYQAHNIQPDFHITLTEECKRDLLSDAKAMQYLDYFDNHISCDAIGGHGFSVVDGQEQPYRIWIAGRLH